MLIVGGGFIGKNLARVASDAGHSCVVLTRSGPWTGPPADVVIADATDRDALAAQVSRAGHVVLAHSGLKPAETQVNPLVDLHAMLRPIEVVFQCLKDRPGVGVTHFSSGGTVYGEAQTIPTPETCPPAPMSFYGVNRLTAEHYLARFATAENPVTILRCSNLYGPYQPASGSQGLVAVVADRLRRSEPITVFGDGGTERDYVLAADVCNAALALAFGPRSPDPVRIFNCGSGEPTRTIDLIHAIATHLRLEATIDFVPDRGFDVRRSVLDITQLRSAIGFEPTRLSHGLRDVLGLPGSG